MTLKKKKKKKKSRVSRSFLQSAPQMFWLYPEIWKCIKIQKYCTRTASRITST